MYVFLHELPVHSGTKAMAMHLKFQGSRRPILFTFLIRYGQMGWPPIAIVFELYSQACAPLNRIHNIPRGRRGRKLLGHRGCSTCGSSGLHAEQQHLRTGIWWETLHRFGFFFLCSLLRNETKFFVFQIQKRFSLLAELSSSECWMRKRTRMRGEDGGTVY